MFFLSDKKCVSSFIHNIYYIIMAEKTFYQEFKGYVPAIHLPSIPIKSGVYLVYSCFLNPTNKTVQVLRLLYIGKADDLNDRLNNHEKMEEWKRQLKWTESLCFSYTFVEPYYNERVEATLINANRPPLNIEYKNYFPFDKTTVYCSGEHAFVGEVSIALKY